MDSKPYGEYRYIKNNKDGLDTTCKGCRIEAARIKREGSTPKSKKNE
jgi:hypothetical protein